MLGDFKVTPTLGESKSQMDESTKEPLTVNKISKGIYFTFFIGLHYLSPTNNVKLSTNFFETFPP